MTSRTKSFDATNYYTRAELKGNKKGRGGALYMFYSDYYINIHFKFTRNHQDNQLDKWKLIHLIILPSGPLQFCKKQKGIRSSLVVCRHRDVINFGKTLYSQFY